MRRENLTTDQVLEVFTEELTTRGGRVIDTFNDGRRLFCRSTLPLSDEASPGDDIHGGIALKFTDEQICVYPYTFRQVCRNGAIHAESIGSLVIESAHQLAPCFVLQSIREGIEACSAPEIFSDTMNRMRDTVHHELDTVLNLMPLLSSVAGQSVKHLLADILNNLFEQKEQTQFSLANAITAAARDTKDPQTRWNLEELGGAVLIAAAPKLPQDSAYAEDLESTEVLQ